jgi:2-aminoethylphosphonate transport system ATP-binding protein
MEDAIFSATSVPGFSTSAARSETGSSVSFEQVSVSYRGATVLKPLDLKVEAGEFLALIGPSGSGKTTALRAVAGFVRPASGRIRIGGVDVTDLPPYERGLGMAVQNYALFPHMRVEQNVAFGLKAQRADKALIAERVQEVLRIVGMSKYAARYPRELSGGQQQRVAIARALAVRPRVLLLDEPLSALDAQIRRTMVEELARLHRELPNLTVLYVTHDQSEALTLADKIAIMRDGELCAYGPTEQLYHRPPNRFAAEFLGRANLLPARVESRCSTSGFATVRIGATRIGGVCGDLAAGKSALLCVRPQNLMLDRGSADLHTLTGTLRDVHWQGELTHIVLDIDATPVRVVLTRPHALPRIGSRLDIHFSSNDASLMAEDAHV